MKRLASPCAVAVLAILALSVLPDSAPAEFNLNLNIGAPPVIVAEPPEVVMVPGSSVYFVPGGDAELLFSGGFWWSPRGDRWYRARAYNGPWGVVERRVVPVEVVRVPRDYRTRYVKEKHIPYGQWKKAHYRDSRQEARHVDGHDRDFRGHEKGGKRGHGRGH